MAINYGILSILFALVFPPIGIILSIIGLVKNKKKNIKSVLPLLGLILSIVLLPVSLILTGMLAYFGVFNPAYILPPTCTFEQGIHCIQYARTGNNDVSMTIQNGLGRDISIVSIKSPACANHEVENALLPNGQMINLRLIDCQFSSKESMTMIEGILNYRYADIENSLDEDVAFEIRIKS